MDIYFYIPCKAKCGKENKLEYTTPLREVLLLLLLLRWLYSPMWTFASLMDFSQSSLQLI
jgi:hypothetical protein